MSDPTSPRPGRRERALRVEADRRRLARLLPGADAYDPRALSSEGDPDLCAIRTRRWAS